MNFYDETAKSYEELHGEEQLKKLRIIANEIPVKKNTKLLDVGCGTGLSAKVFNCSIMGIDPSQELIRQCPFKTILSIAEDMPFPENSYDVVIAVTSIHNFDDIEKGLKEIKRVGKNLFALTILKKSPKKENILTLIKKHFSVKKQINEDKDLIIICTNI